ncbi:MAG: acetylornithine deacetylase [Gammaproteobacteria bacterium]|nr:acetylornithine deacetylase [Gammaproteobacteria bacterium]MYD76279.1 acetylornithine deacetylase [Gammaproteobacteria bacterium]MYJ51317.1 acetylornithine deacetylase [Gammaproteobacteria bacterium]
MSENSSVALLNDLVAFDTTSRNSNLQLIEYVISLLEPHGIPFDLTHDDDGRKANLFATLGNPNAPGIVLSGHTDVVPVDGQDWSSDPFGTEVRGTRLYGRGVCDMKGFIALCLSRIRTILDADLDIPVHFAFSYDEEIGCLGVSKLLEGLRDRPVRPKACIIGEPTGMQPVRAHKGMLFKRCHVHGKSAHSSMVDKGVNAVTSAARIIAKVDEIQRRIIRDGPFDPAFDPPYTSLHCGVIHGGTVNNIIPSECRFDFEIRNLPDQSAEALFDEVRSYAETVIQAEMQAVARQTGIQWQTLADYPGMDTPEKDPLVREVSRLLGCDTPPGKVSYGTEGGHFQAFGIPTVVCGPGHIAQAHKPDEFIDLEQMERGGRFVDALIRSLA